MLNELEKLSTEQQSQLLDAVPLITILVAGADGNMDEAELATAEKITKIRTYDSSIEVRPYFMRVGEIYTGRLNQLIAELPNDTAARTQAISERLAALNPLLQAMDIGTTNQLLGDFRSFARHVASASGGVLGFMTISGEEKEVVDLPMLLAAE
ncbi:MAG: hypothetical protein AAGJ82_01745 [Bacteroidota bacterium]